MFCPSNGTLDTTFGGDGKVMTSVLGDFDQARSVAIQGDGKIVAAGAVRNGLTSYFGVARFNADGSLDTSFAGDGTTATSFFGQFADGANSVGAAEPLDAAQRAADANVPFYTIALGTEEGRVTVEDQFGIPVTLDVPPDRETLAQIAEITDATAFDAPTAEDLQAVYANLQSRVGFTEEEQEVTAWFAGAALVLVVIGAGLSALWFGRLP